jgi:hypothetical protein
MLFFFFFFGLGLPLEHDSPTYATGVAGITVTRPNLAYCVEMGVCSEQCLANFLPELALNLDLPISDS